MEEIKMCVVDALGIPPVIGDTVVIAPAKRGAQEFIKGTINKVNEKTVTIEHGAEAYDLPSRKYVWKDNATSSNRKSGCFVIVKEQ